MAFEISNRILRDAIAKRGFPPPSEDATHLFGIRGAVPWEPPTPDGKFYLSLKTNVVDQWNDTLGVFGQVFGRWKGTVDPGLIYTQDPLNTSGCAHLQDGRWQYTDGLHKGNPAFVQAAPVTVWRDYDEDSAKDQGEKVESGYFGINIHAGEGPVVGEWSAGCQVLFSDHGWSGPQWTDFYEAAHRTGQVSWYYFLLEAADVAP
jgi:hypothetical protein